MECSVMGGMASVAMMPEAMQALVAAQKPVSYTHLDVYKRQTSSRIGSWFPSRRGSLRSAGDNFREGGPGGFRPKRRSGSRRASSTHRRRRAAAHPSEMTGIADERRPLPANTRVA